ncbi:hypothetical protein GCM10009742_40650 [Kribbella karoonensis]|uniref:Uncharacterized protein n=1 Tax=Kribbella karoonensis TaxID=324851 RepID=A0ABN2E019_9ACTN
MTGGSTRVVAAAASGTNPRANTTISSRTPLQAARQLARRREPALSSTSRRGASYLPAAPATEHRAGGGQGQAGGEVGGQEVGGRR